MYTHSFGSDAPSPYFPFFSSPLFFYFICHKPAKNCCALNEQQVWEEIPCSYTFFLATWWFSKCCSFDTWQFLLKIIHMDWRCNSLTIGKILKKSRRINFLTILFPCSSHLSFARLAMSLNQKSCVINIHCCTML